jgi:pyruvate dehydrogenase E1 component beta subunit
MREITYHEAIKEAIRLEMRRDPNVILIGNDISGGAGHKDSRLLDTWGGPFGTTKGILTEFGPERVMDTPISEAAFTGAAVGAAVTGLRPLLDLMFVDFLTVCADPLFNQGAKMRYLLNGKVSVPLTIKLSVGCGLGAAAHHSQMWTSILSHLPGLKCVAPATPYDAKGLLIAAIRDDDPVIYCEHKLLYSKKEDVPEELYEVPIGRAETRREGTDVTLVSYSYLVHPCLSAADKLAAEGIEAEVVDLRSLSPLDSESVLRSVAKTGRLVVVDEDTPRCSIATDVAALVAQKAFHQLRCPIELVTAPHTPVPFSPALEKAYLPSEARIIEAIRRAMAFRSPASLAGTRA